MYAASFEAFVARQLACAPDDKDDVNAVNDSSGDDQINVVDDSSDDESISVVDDSDDDKTAARTRPARPSSGPRRSIRRG